MAEMIDQGELYLRLKKATIGIQGQFGLGCLSWYQADEMTPYVVFILEWLQDKLILSGSETILQRLQEFVELYQRGTTYVIDSDILTLCSELKIPTDSTDYSQDHLILCWGNLMTALYLQLVAKYSSMFMSPEIADCHTLCKCSESLESGQNLTLGTGTWQPGICGCLGY